MLSNKYGCKKVAVLNFSSNTDTAFALSAIDISNRAALEQLRCGLLLAKKDTNLHLAFWASNIAAPKHNLSVRPAFFAALTSRAMRFHSLQAASTKSCEFPKRATHPLAGVARQRGQALPLGVGLLLVIASFLYLMVNSGQSVTEKIRVTNAADAAAYSAGVVEARTLNYDAYTNRAIVANEIVIAQLVSLASWTDYFATAAQIYPVVSPVTNALLLPNLRVLQLDAVFFGADVATIANGQSPRQYADAVVQGLGGAIAAVDLAVLALSCSQQLVQLSTTAAVSQQLLATRVVQAMDPALRAEVVPTSFGWDSFTKNYSRTGDDGDERARMADVTVRSRDLFTRERNWDASSFDIPLIRKNGALKKRGGTDLIGFDEWRAVDTLELHGQTWTCTRRIWFVRVPTWCDDVQIPTGWGFQRADSGGDDAGRGYHGNAYSENPRTAATAESEMRPALTFRGIPDSRDMADLGHTAAITTGITVRVSKSHASTLTSANAAQFKTTGALDLYSSRLAGGQMAALSRAEIYFDRTAARADGKTELASLFNPYWRVRLVSPTVEDKAFSAALQAGLALP